MIVYCHFINHYHSSTDVFLKIIRKVEIVIPEKVVVAREKALRLKIEKL